MRRINRRVLANNRIRRRRARSLAEGREDVPFNSLRVGIVSENRFRAAVANVNTRSPEFFGSRDPSLSSSPSSRPALSSSPHPFPLRHRALLLAARDPFDRPALNTNDRHFLPLIDVFRRRWPPLNFNSPSRFDARILPSHFAITSRFTRHHACESLDCNLQNDILRNIFGVAINARTDDDVFPG